MLVKGTLRIAPAPSAGENPNDNNKKVVFKIVFHLLIA